MPRIPLHSPRSKTNEASPIHDTQKESLNLFRTAERLRKDYAAGMFEKLLDAQRDSRYAWDSNAHPGNEWWAENGGTASQVRSLSRPPNLNPFSDMTQIYNLYVVCIYIYIYICMIEYVYRIYIYTHMIYIYI